MLKVICSKVLLFRTSKGLSKQAEPEDLASTPGLTKGTVLDGPSKAGCSPRHHPRAFLQLQKGTKPKQPVKTKPDGRMEMVSNLST